MAERSPGSRTKSFRTCQGLRPRRAVGTLALSRSAMSPSVGIKTSAPGIFDFRGSTAGLCAPLPTLRLRPRERKRTAWGRCGSLLLHRIGLAPITPCRSPGAQSPQLHQEVRPSKGGFRLPGGARSFNGLARATAVCEDRFAAIRLARAKFRTASLCDEIRVPKCDQQSQLVTAIDGGWCW
jgi:hypothetical protein